MAIKIVRGNPIKPHQEQSAQGAAVSLAEPAVVVAPNQEDPQSSAPDTEQSLGALSEVLALSVGSKSKEPPPWEVDESYTILDALSELHDPKHKGKTLTLVSKKDPSAVYIVKSFDPSTRRAVLEGPFKGGQLRPVITEREVPLYFPVWR